MISYPLCPLGFCWQTTKFHRQIARSRQFCHILTAKNITERKPKLSLSATARTPLPTFETSWEKSVLPLREFVFAWKWLIGSIQVSIDRSLAVPCIGTSFGKWLHRCFFHSRHRERDSQHR